MRRSTVSILLFSFALILPGAMAHANPNAKKNDSGGGIGLSITIDPSKLFKSGKKKPAPKRRPARRRVPSKKRFTAAPPRTGGPCPKHLVNLMGDAGYWRELADAADAEAAMARDAARGWRAISQKAAQGAAYAKKSGLASSEDFLGKKASELEQRAKDYEAKAGEKEAAAQALREKADAEDANRATHEKEWCGEYRRSTQTAFSPQSVTISTQPGTSAGSVKNDPLKNQFDSAQKAQADARFRDRVAEAEREKERAGTSGSKQDERDQEKEYREPGEMYLDKTQYTAEDMKEYAERWKAAPDQNRPVILGAGYGLGPDIMELALWRPDLAATLLNRLSELETGDLAGILEAVKLIRQQTAGALKIATEFGKPLESWGKSRMDSAVERMETTLERQIGRESKPDVAQKTPPSTTNERTPAGGETPSPTPPGNGTATGVPVTFAPVPVNGCVERSFILPGDAGYWREQADIADTEAAMARKAARGWRRISEQAAGGATQAGKAKLKDSQKFQDDKAAELESRANDYDARAAQKEAEAKALREAADAEDRKRAALEKERCKTREDLPRNAFSPEPVKVSTGPETPPSSKIPTAPKTICGPDITDVVFRELDNIHTDWNGWSELKKLDKCSDLINYKTALSSWDLKFLRPGRGSKTREEFTSTEAYERYFKFGKFWFEEFGAACGKPRKQCVATVTFLGKCIHPQVVNYVQWGVMRKLCAHQAPLMEAAHRTRAGLTRTPRETYDGQKIMAGVGGAYTEATRGGKYYEEAPLQTADPGEKASRRQARSENIKNQMKEKLKELMAEPGNSDFASRPAINCAVPCQMTAAEKDNLSKQNYGYEWGK